MHPRNNFDFLRLAAAMCVLLSHQHVLTGLPEPAFWGVQSLGGIGVTVFFVISGFLVAQSWLADPHVGRFAARRLLRIWPGYAVVILLSALVLGPFVTTLPLRDYFTDGVFWKYFKNLHFTLHDRLPLRFEGSAMPPAVNGALWTIPLELRCYLMLVLAALAGLLRWRWLLAGLTLATALVYLAPMLGLHGFTDSYHWSDQRRPLLEFALYFFAGTVFFLFGLHRGHRAPLVALGTAWVLGAAAMALGQPLLALWLVTPATVITVGVASTAGLRDAGRFGDLSYGVYIYAFPVQQTLIWTLKDRMSWGALLALTLAVTLAFAFASWHLVEKRALRLKPRKRIRPVPASAPTVVATA